MSATELVNATDVQTFLDHTSVIVITGTTTLQLPIPAMVSVYALNKFVIQVHFNYVLLVVYKHIKMLLFKPVSRCGCHKLCK